MELPQRPQPLDTCNFVNDLARHERFVKKLMHGQHGWESWHYSS